MASASPTARVKGERSAAQTRVNMEATPYSTLNSFQLEEARDTVYSYRDSQDNSSAITVITNIKNGLTDARKVLDDFKVECQELHSQIDTRREHSQEEIGKIPDDIITKVGELRETLRGMFVEQQEVNFRLNKCVSVLDKEKQVLEYSTSEALQRVSMMEELVSSEPLNE